MLEALKAEVAELRSLVESLVPKDRIVLTSPDGTNTITIEATDKGSGVWLQRHQGEPAVAIYNGFGEGAVVGVWGSHDRGFPMKGCDACLHAGGPGFQRGGFLQIVDEAGNIRQLSAEDFA